MKKQMPFLLTLLLLTGCNPNAQRNVSAERSGADYQTAMAAYQSGRLEEAIEGFRKSLTANPLNQSARFQLACLLQDGQKDALAAYCMYAEFLLQNPSGDKVHLARERMMACERGVAETLARKYGLDKTQTILEELATVRAAEETATKRVKELEVTLAEMQRASAALSSEKSRLLAAARQEGEVAESDEIDALQSRKDAQSALRENREEVDRIKLSEDLAALRAEGDAEKALGTKTSLLPPPTKAEEAKPTRKNVERTEPAHEPRPETYVVQEGDTLYRIALRFYGRRSAWKSIQQANRAIISSDGRLRKGQTLRLPEE